jgi:predicted RNase H-like HicB family nuclease
MEKIRVDVSWCEKNFSASLGENVHGAVVFTADTFAELQKEAKESLEFHVEGMVADGDDVPQWLVDGDYEFEYRFLDAISLLRAYEPFLSLAAISRASGINQHLLSHYANGLKRPRPEQRRRIVEGLHKIGRELISVE